MPFNYTTTATSSLFNAKPEQETTVIIISTTSSTLRPSIASTTLTATEISRVNSITMKKKATPPRAFTINGVVASSKVPEIANVANALTSSSDPTTAKPSAVTNRFKNIPNSHITGISEVKNRHIFFHETVHNWLDMRQTCAVESAAKNNPQRPVKIFLINSTVAVINSSSSSSTSSNSNSSSSTNNSSKNTSSTLWMSVLKNYSNINVTFIDAGEYFNATPMEDWYRKGIWRSSQHSTEHFSDYIRMLTAFKEGGHYLDLDFITFKPFNDSLLNYFFSLEHTGTGEITNSVFHFDRGHRLINEIIKRLASSYRPDLWAFHGLNAVTDIVTKFCNFTRAIGPTSNQCPDLRILPPQHFFSIHWMQWKTLFENNTDNSFQKQMPALFNNSYASHVWNKLSSNTPLVVGSNQGYWHLARQHCPITVARATEFPSRSK